MIRAIVFDCFGVLASEGLLPFKRKHFGDKPELNARVSELMRETNAGRASYDEFVRELARMAGLREETVRFEIEGNVPDTQLFAYIATLKPRYRLGLLSNAAGNWLPQIFTPDQLALLDAVALSYEIGFIKPEPQAFAVIAERLGVGMSECLMVDDQPRFCAAAEAADMPGLAYIDVAQFERELPDMLKQA